MSPSLDFDPKLVLKVNDLKREYDSLNKAIIDLRDRKKKEEQTENDELKRSLREFNARRREEEQTYAKKMREFSDAQALLDKRIKSVEKLELQRNELAEKEKTVNLFAVQVEKRRHELNERERVLGNRENEVASKLDHAAKLKDETEVLRLRLENERRDFSAQKAKGEDELKNAKETIDYMLKLQNQVSDQLREANTKSDESQKQLKEAKEALDKANEKEAEAKSLFEKAVEYKRNADNIKILYERKERDLETKKTQFDLKQLKGEK